MIQIIFYQYLGGRSNAFLNFIKPVKLYLLLKKKKKTFN